MFLNALKDGCSIAEKGKNLVTIGITPDYPETGYGYIKFLPQQADGNAYAVDRFVEKPDMETAKEYLAAVADAAATAVTYTSQKYVDELKKSGQFTKENQREALGLAVAQAKNLLTAEATAFLESAYGDLTEYLQSRIEAEVRNQKIGMATLTLSA